VGRRNGGKVVCSWKRVDSGSTELYEVIQEPRPQSNSVIRTILGCMYVQLGDGQLRRAGYRKGVMEGRPYVRGNASSPDRLSSTRENRENLVLSLIQ